MPANWTFDDLDRRIAAELQGFLPDRLCDAHAHLYRTSSLNLAGPSLWTEGPEVVDVAAWREHIGRQVGAERLAGALFVANPCGDLQAMAAENAFVIAQCDSVSDARGIVVITPEDSPDAVASFLPHPRLAGFKPYHIYSAETPTFESSIGGYLPEWAWELANERGLIILLHLVKARALSDPDNQRYIRSHCLRYPNAKLILAHAARGFHVPNTVEGLASLRGLENVWFDTSGVCETAAIRAILMEFGPRRLMWGTDFPVSEIRGRCVTVGDGFAWLQPDTLAWEKLKPGCEPTLVGLESLRSLRQVADEFGLNADDLQDIFADNALRLIGVKRESGTVTQDLYRHAKQRMPGGTQLLSKRPEMLAPNQWPAYFREARGCECWDLDGRHYYDFISSGIASCLLGFRDPDVTHAVQRRISLGSMCTLNPPEEVELADLLCEIHPWAEQVRYARCGGESCSIAVRIARATTDRSVIAICGYSGWQDWYLAANLGESDALRGHLLPGLQPLGVPVELRGTTVTFRFNQREELQSIIDAHGDRLAAVIMEPCRNVDPEPGFLEFVRDSVHNVGALLIFDEITIGWRLHFGGAHLRFGVNPDIAIFAKAMSNGHPMGAIIGTTEAMAGAHDSFISSTYWTESVGPTAALATIKKLRQLDAPAHVARIGHMVQSLWREHGKQHGLPVAVSEGHPCLANFSFQHDLAQELRTLYTQWMLERGFLAGTYFDPTLAHTDDLVALHGKAVDEVFGEIAKALDAGDVTARLKGPVAHTGFARLVS
jgi:glutamate-1-semialdehyde 2,1-aminomutase